MLTIHIIHSTKCLIIIPSTLLSQPKLRRDDEPKIKIWKNKEFGVATIVYSGKLRKNKKDKTRFAKKADFGSKSRLRMGKVLAPHNVRPKMVPLIKYTKRYDFFKIFIFPKNNIKWCTKEKNVFFLFFRLDKD